MTKLGMRDEKEASIKNRLQNCENTLYSLDEYEVPELYILQENKAVMDAKHQVKRRFQKNSNFFLKFFFFSCYFRNR